MSHALTGLTLGKARYKRTTGPRGNPTKTYRRHFPIKSRSAYSRKPVFRRKATSPAKLPRLPGSFTFTGQGATVTWTTGNQGVDWDNDDYSIMNASDVYSTIGAAAINMRTEPVFGTPAARRLFWITNCNLSVNVTNASQNDCVVICYPYTVRYTGPSQISTIGGDYQGGSSLGTAGSGANTLANTVYGTTPFQYIGLTQYLKFGKPRSVLLQGGQHKTFHMSYRKKFMVNDAVFGTPITTETAANIVIGKVSRGFLFSYRAQTTNGSGADEAQVGFGSGKVISSTIRTYNYESCVIPYSYRDTQQQAYDPDDEAIILPQTGAITSPATT